MNKFRALYDKSLPIKIVTVIMVVFLSIAIMLPLIKLAEWFGVNVMENNNTGLKVDFANAFFFFLFGCCSVAIIWLAQKYLHRGKLADLGFRTKVLKLFLIGFVVGVINIGLEYLIFGLSATEVRFVTVVPNDVSILSYIGYYLYFFFGMIVWNSFIEELGTRSYPIESLKGHLNPHIIFTVMGVIFTAGHFVVHDFNIPSCVSIFLSSYIYSLVYYYSRSIWLVIGMHSGLNWFGFSFGGSITNWKLGAIMRIEIYDIPDSVYHLSGPIIDVALLLLVVHLHKSGFFQKKLS